MALSDLLECGSRSCSTLAKNAFIPIFKSLTFAVEQEPL